MKCSLAAAAVLAIAMPSMLVAQVPITLNCSNGGTGSDGAFNPAMNTVLDTSIQSVYNYTSMTTPYSVYDYQMDSRERELLKRTEVLGGFDPNDYVTERLWAEGGEG